MPDEILSNTNLTSNESSGELPTSPAIPPVRLDPIYLERIKPYVSHGLEIATANPNVVNRDANNNIILEENSEENQKLLIEQNSIRYTKDSFERNIDTQFKYFKFPPTVRIISTNNGELEIPEFEETDIVSARYKPLYEPDGWYRMRTSYESVAGEGSGPRRLIFNQVVAGTLQSEPNTFIITPEMITFLNGRDLKMKFKVDVHAPDHKTNFNVAFYRSNPEWRDAPNYNLGTSKIVEAKAWNTLEHELIIPNRDIIKYDLWEIRGVAGNPAWYIAPGTYWEITIVDA